MKNNEQDMKKIAEEKNTGWSFIDDGKGTKIIKQGETNGNNK